jgi:hypothetical protein
MRTVTLLMCDYEIFRENKGWMRATIKPGGLHPPGNRRHLVAAFNPTTTFLKVPLPNLKLLYNYPRVKGGLSEGREIYSRRELGTISTLSVHMNR